MQEAVSKRHLDRLMFTTPRIDSDDPLQIATSNTTHGSLSQNTTNSVIDELFDKKSVILN